MTLFERLEMKLGEHPETMRACVEMAKAWRMDKYLRRLEAIMIVCDADVSLTLTGTGDVIEPEDGIIGIGSGGAFATAAARALIDVEGMEAEAIGRKVLIPFHTPPHPSPTRTLNPSYPSPYGPLPCTPPYPPHLYTPPYPTHPELPTQN